MSSIHRFTECTNAGVHACHIAQLYNTQSQGARWNEFRRTLVTNPVKPKRFRRENVLYCAMEIKNKNKNKPTTFKQSLGQKLGTSLSIDTTIL